MTGRPAPGITLIGVGNPYRHDDGAGRLVAERAALATGVEVEPLSPGDATDLLERWAGSDLAIVVDATRSGSAPGTVRIMEIGDDTDVVGARAASSHALGLAGAVRLSRCLGSAPRRVVVVGVEGADFDPGEGLSREVADAVPVAVRVVVELIREARRCAPAGSSG